MFYLQTHSLGLFRSDYMLDGDMKIKQVEFNTIASSFGGLAPVVSKLHKFVLSELGKLEQMKNVSLINLQ